MAKFLPSANGKKKHERSEKLGIFHIKSVLLFQFAFQSGTFKQNLE